MIDDNNKFDVMAQAFIDNLQLAELKALGVLMLNVDNAVIMDCLMQKLDEVSYRFTDELADIQVCSACNGVLTYGTETKHCNKCRGVGRVDHEFPDLALAIEIDRQVVDTIKDHYECMLNNSDISKIITDLLSVRE